MPPMPNVEFYQDDSPKKEWRWRVVEAGQVLGKSTEGYSRRHNAENNLRSLPSYARSPDIRTAAGLAGSRVATARLPLEFYEDNDGKWRWRITAANGNIVHGSAVAESTKGEAVLNLERVVATVERWKG